jgi:outer membrane protein
VTSKTATALAAGLLLSLAGSPAPAEEIPLTLGEALARAEGNNPDILAAQQRAAAQGSRIESVERLRWPRLDVTMGWSRTNTPAMVFMGKLNAGEFTQNDFAIDSLNSPDPLSHLMTVLSVMAPVDLAGKVKAMSSAQAAVERAMQAGTLEMLQEIRVRVVEAYRNAELAARAVALTQRALEGALARERDIQARVEEGAALQADLLRARSRRRQREADLAERRGQRRMAQAALARLLGAEPGTLFDPIEAPVAPAPIEGDLDTWTRRALERRPVFTATQEKREAARWMRTAEDRALLPDVGVFGQVQDDRNSFSGGKQNWAFGAMLKWGAFDPGRSKRLAAAQADERAAELETRSAADQIRLEVEMAYRRAESARERYAAAAGGAEEGREALRVLQERRQSGMATLTDELEAETASLGAELAEIQAASEAALADAALRRAAGEL